MAPRVKQMIDFASKLKSQYHDINSANNSVAIDVVVVRSRDGTYKSSPFYVRFGKLDILKSSGQTVEIEVNGQYVSDISMRLDENGEGHFRFENVKSQPSEQDVVILNGRNSPTLQEASPFFKASQMLKEMMEKQQQEQSSTLSNRHSRSMDNLFDLGKHEIKKNGSWPDNLSQIKPAESPKTPKSSRSKTTNNDVKRNLNHELIEKLGLKDGHNEIKYFIFTPKGFKVVHGNIFLWKHDDKIVISDIDGTITRSAFRGQVLPLLKKSWFHENITHLYSSIVKQGYKILYLSARPFFQSDITRNILRSIRQEEACLPVGPVIVNPADFLRAFQIEIIYKTPDEFKISFLNGIKELFDQVNPFYAGFGDKLTDYVAYNAVGIQDSLIFVINQAGHVNFNPKSIDQLTYKAILNNVHKYFPSLV